MTRLTPPLKQNPQNIQTSRGAAFLSLNLAFFLKTGFDALQMELPATNTHKLIYKKMC